MIRRALKKAAQSGVIALAVSINKILPGKAMAVFIEHTSLVGKLDYKPHDIWLNIQSRGEFVTRLTSCAKEPETVAWIEELVRPGDVMFDIGANVGAYSLVASKATQGEASIYAFEPAFTNYPQLCRNIMLNECSNSIVPLPHSIAKRNSPVGYTPAQPVVGISATKLRATRSTIETDACGNWLKVSKKRSPSSISA